VGKSKSLLASPPRLPPRWGKGRKSEGRDRKEDRHPTGKKKKGEEGESCLPSFPIRHPEDAKEERREKEEEE